MARYNIVKNIRKRKIIILVVLLILIMVSWLIWGNLSVETNKLTVTSKDLPEAFDNFSIAHISDLHNAESDEKNQKNTVIMICFAVTVILGLISWKGIKAKESE